MRLRSTAVCCGAIFGADRASCTVGGVDHEFLDTVERGGAASTAGLKSARTSTTPCGPGRMRVKPPNTQPLAAELSASGHCRRSEHGRPRWCAVQQRQCEGPRPECGRRPSAKPGHQMRHQLLLGVAVVLAQFYLRFGNCKTFKWSLPQLQTSSSEKSCRNHWRQAALKKHHARTTSGNSATQLYYILREK